jgi:hypothetical protein
MVELLKRVFAASLAGFCITLLLFIAFRVVEPIAGQNSLFVKAGNLVLYWPTRFHVFGVSGCPNVDPLVRIKCLEIAFGIDVLAYAILFFLALSLQKTIAVRRMLTT